MYKSASDKPEIRNTKVYLISRSTRYSSLFLTAVSNVQRCKHSGR